GMTLFIYVSLLSPLDKGAATAGDQPMSVNSAMGINGSPLGEGLGDVELCSSRRVGNPFCQATDLTPDPVGLGSANTSLTYEREID
ncbi:MAG: hypothetical protein O2890_12205, partial [Cyanobacteria bacterium]|nr:hypothetical protein [Cyanobacteriota bacterium]